MAKLNIIHGHWLTSAGLSRGSEDNCVPVPATNASAGVFTGTACRLGRAASVLPGLFSRARLPRGGYASHEGEATNDGTPPSVEAVEVEYERKMRAEAIASLADGLRACEVALITCETALPPADRSRVKDCLRTLKTEYARLCDAERFLFERRLRQVRVGEDDDDPEFTIVLERVVYAVDRGDDVETSVAQAVQTIAAVLLPYLEERTLSSSSRELP